MRKSGLNCSRRRRRRRRRTWLFFHSMRPLRFLLHSAWNSYRQTVKTCLQSEREVFLLRQSYSASWSVVVETVHIHLHCVLNQFAHGHLKHTYVVGAPGSTHPSSGHIVCLTNNLKFSLHLSFSLSTDLSHQSLHLTRIQPVKKQFFTSWT